MTETLLLAYIIFTLGVIASLLLVCIGITVGKFVTEKQFNNQMSEIAEAIMNGEIEVSKTGVAIIRKDTKGDVKGGDADE